MGQEKIFPVIMDDYHVTKHNIISFAVTFEPKLLNSAVKVISLGVKCNISQQISRENQNLINLSIIYVKTHKNTSDKAIYSH